MTSMQIGFLVFLFGVIGVLIAMVFHSLYAVRKFNLWMDKASERDLRNTSQLRGISSDWPVFVLKWGKELPAPVLSEGWTIWQRNEITDQAVGQILTKIGLNEALFQESKYQIYVGNAELSFSVHYKLILKKDGSVVRAWDLNRRSLWKRLFEDKFLWFECKQDGNHYEIHRNQDRYELLQGGTIKGVIGIGGFESRPASINAQVPSDIALSLFYCARLHYEGPRIHNAKHAE